MALVLENVNSLVNDAVSALIDKYTPALKNMASDAGWPQNLVDALEITYVRGNIIITYPDQLSQEIEDLEYGIPQGIPNSVIRPFMNRYEFSANKDISEIVAENIFTYGGGW